MSNSCLLNFLKKCSGTVLSQLVVHPFGSFLKNLKQISQTLIQLYLVKGTVFSSFLDRF